LAFRARIVCVASVTDAAVRVGIADAVGEQIALPVGRVVAGHIIPAVAGGVRARPRGVGGRPVDGCRRDLLGALGVAEHGDLGDNPVVAHLVRVGDLPFIRHSLGCHQ
jgi:hypothetical protein